MYIRISHAWHIYFIYLSMRKTHWSSFAAFNYVFCLQWCSMSTLSRVSRDRLYAFDAHHFMRQSTTLCKNAVANAVMVKISCAVANFPVSLSLLKFHWNLVNAKVTTIKVFYEVLARSNVTKQAIFRAKTFDKTIIFYRLQGIHENGKLKQKKEKR